MFFKSRVHFGLLAAFFLAFLPIASAQVVSLAGVINRYQAVTALDSCTGGLTVADTAGFRVGTRVLLIQMQGATASTANNGSYGSLQNLRGAGLFEENFIDSVALNRVFLKNKLANNYEVLGKIQILNFPTFDNAQVTDTLRARPWDGTTGGILAFEVTNQLELKAPIALDGLGFRGGLPFNASDNNCWWAFSQDDYFYGAGNWRGANKGEGLFIAPNGHELGRGPLLTGGGGGNDHNSGGGGGANRTAGGGGGRNDEPEPLGCDSEFPGLGGRAINNPGARLFLGGGGGAGHANNALRSRGGNGGGILLLKAGSLVGNFPISSNGEHGEQGVGDGAGGGGAGGSIWIQIVQNPSFLPNIQTNGGDGGRTRQNNQPRCLGPGGGGGGGFVATNLTNISAPTGGLAGRVVGSTDPCLDSTNGATDGSGGLVASVFSIPSRALTFKEAQPVVVQNPTNQTACVGDVVVFSCTAAGNNLTYQWQIWNNGSWQNLSNASPYTGAFSRFLGILNASATLFGSRFRCVVSSATCANEQVISTEATLVLGAAPTADFSYSNTGLSINLTNLSQNFTQIRWDFGDGGSSSQANPSYTYAQSGTYFVNLVVWNGCDTVQTVQTITVAQPPTANFMAPDTLRACGTAALNLLSLTSGDTPMSLQWTIPGASPASAFGTAVSVTFPQGGSYPITLTAINVGGTNSITRTVVVEILPNLIADFGQNVNGLQVQFTNLSQNGVLGQLWDFGDGNTSNSPNPIHTYTQTGNFIATLTVWNACDTLTTAQQVLLPQAPTAAFFLPDTLASCGLVMANLQSQSTGLGPITHTWTIPGAIPSSGTGDNIAVRFQTTGQYSATLTATNAVGSTTVERTFFVQILTLPNVAFFSTPNGNTVQFTNQTTGYDFVSWSFGDGGTSFLPNPSHTYTTNGVFTVTLSASNACGGSVLQQVLTVGTNSLSEEKEKKDTWYMYPNPSENGMVTIDCASCDLGFEKINIYASNGYLVAKTTQPNRFPFRFEHEITEKGVYFVQILLENGAVVLVKMVVQ